LTDLVTLEALSQSLAGHVPQRLLARNQAALEAGCTAARLVREGAVYG
jgi:hypothetical protein